MNALSRFLFLFGCASLLTPAARLGAAVYYVDVARGSDTNAGTQGAPFRSTAKAIKTAQAGDTVTILKVDFPIHEAVTIINKSGEPGRPITVDGQGNLFTGADPLRPADWKEIRPGVYRNDHLLPELKTGTPGTAATIQRYFMMWNGVENRMGRSSKGDRAPFVLPENLKPGEWTYIDAETAFYVAIDPAKKLDDYHIETPIRQNGVGLGGTCMHWVIRNVNATHVINDGFNIHGHTEDLLFENITSTECGDDGLSAHEDCVLAVRNFVSRRNSTGICHGDPAVVCTCDHVVLEDNYGYNLLLRSGENVFTNSTISAKPAVGGKGGIALTNELAPGATGPLRVKFVACHVPFPTEPPPSGNKGYFTVVEGVILDLSPDTKVDGPITRLPPRKPK